MDTQYKWLILLLIFGYISCESDDDTSTVGEEIVVTSGNADFSKFVSLGNSMTAGFTDGALFIAGQENSISNILAKQFTLAGGGEFKQPLMNDNIGGALVAGTPTLNPRFYFYSDPNPDPPNESGPRLLGTTPDDDTPEVPTTEITNIISGPFNNMGIPGAKSFHLSAAGYGNAAGLPNLANPYFVRIASSPTASVLGDAIAQNPTFFSLWIGNNDVLGYALSGGDGTDPITDETTFTQAYNALITTLTSGETKGVVFNIPDVTSLPHFTTVPYNPVPLDATKAGAVNQGYAMYNAGLLQAENLGGIDEAERKARTIKFVEGQNAVVIEDESLTNLTGSGLPNYRHATAKDLLVLPSSSFIGTTVGGNPLLINGVSVPLEDKWVLIPTEQQEITTATNTFNTIISTTVQQAGLAFVDVNMLLNQISENENGVPFDEFFLNDNLVFGGAFSLDGVHPTARGYAFLANKAMESINTTYGSNLPMVKAVDYPTFYSPLLK
ncbi:GDSL-like lipase/acylhydrolase family protein [Aquimarina sp. MAR_2010_214]|uniref:G-D-S-L family lipolytic protein n=1 Tax=Aquimarina sp. MAR_2010_214 TaxID=1250026 RepID=UPI000C6FEDB1|nr:G-D-S-L family lipolytic protein [Aquimarina sp. MAR_2010_214]PKV48469.1 GDSL-like lipase/acylhydrolase family protein [Aquimarina sp. MAR_2010_214]